MSRLQDLHPAFQPYAKLLLEWLQQQGPYIVTSAVRSNAEQQRLYDLYVQGRHPLTVAPPGCSKHQLGLAVDFARLGVASKDDPVLAYLGRWWRSIGGEWGGEADPVHFGLPGRMCR